METQTDVASTSNIPSNQMNKTLCPQFFYNIFRRKDISEDMMRKDLRRCFNLGDLVFLSISAMMGSGLYVLAGTVIRNIAGPSIVISFIIAAIASSLSALCYAEFAARIPVAGSAYQFTYLTIGEFWAFVVGWNVASEHIIYVAAIAKTCSGYFDGLLGNVFQKYMLKHAPMPGGFIATYPDLLSAAFIVFFAAILLCGVKLSSKINIAVSAINMIVIFFIIVTGFILADWDNWLTDKGGFFPYGWEGTIRGSTPLINSYVGYEVVASATEETINAARDIPLSLLISLLVVVVAYVGGSASLTLIVPWYDVDVNNPYPLAYEMRGWYWAKYVVSIGALAAMFTSLLSIMYVVPRYLLAMARDGLLPGFLNALYSKTQVPYVSTLIVATLSMILSTIFTLATLVEFVAVGQLIACTFVGISVIRLRYMPNYISSYKRADQYDESTLDSEAKEETSTQESSNVPKENISLYTQSQFSYGTNESSSSFDSSNVSTPHDEGERNQTDNNIYDPSLQYGTIKKTVLNSKLGFMFKWTTKYEAGDVPLYSLVLAILSAAAVIAMLVYAASFITKWWFVLLLILLCSTSLSCLVLIALHIQDDSFQTFKVPLVPFLPYCSIVINILLLLNLTKLTWIRFGVWMAVGFVIYFAYGYQHSETGKKKKS